MAVDITVGDPNLTLFFGTAKSTVIVSVIWLSPSFTVAMDGPFFAFGSTGWQRILKGALTLL
jgi:hypothetical protein